jgi:hypothetical protein
MDDQIFLLIYVCLRVAGPDGVEGENAAVSAAAILP